jgi:hypothetical protein
MHKRSLPGYIANNELPDRYSVTRQAIHQQQIRGTFPPPDKVINGRKYWKCETLDRFDRSNMPPDNWKTD